MNPLITVNSRIVGKPEVISSISKAFRIGGDKSPSHPTAKVRADIARALRQQQRVMEVAEAMPAEKYEFAPAAGEFKGVRTFAEQLRHVAADNYLLGAGILGEKPPVETGKGESGSSAVRTKPEIIAYLKASFTYMRRAATSIDDVNTPIPTPRISPWLAGTATRLGLAIEDCVHTYDHYGQLVEYLRMNGIIPPASRR